MFSEVAFGLVTTSSFLYVTIMNEKVVPFTHIAIILGLASHLFKNEFFYAVSNSLFWGIAFAFYFVPLLDSTAYTRFMLKNAWPPFVFYSGNFLLHAFPCILMTCYPPPESTRLHGLTAAFLHLLWGAFATYKNYELRWFCLNKTYIPLSARNWAILWTISTICELCVGVASTDPLPITEDHHLHDSMSNTHAYSS